MKVIADAPGKLVLLGEYAVLEGAPGLVVAVDRRARVVLEQHLCEVGRARSLEQLPRLWYLLQHALAQTGRVAAALL